MPLLRIWRRSSPPARGRVRTAVIPRWPAFASSIERSLRLLHEVHVPVSLFALRLDGGDKAVDAAAGALVRFGAVGRLPDGSLGLLYLGPRPAGRRGEAALENQIFMTAAHGLGEQGWAAVGETPVLTAVHSWTDQVRDVAALVAASSAARPH